MLAESLMAIPGRQSKLRVTMKFLRLIGRVVRRLVWETATDETLGLSAQMAYQFLFTLAPGLLFLWHLLGLFGTDPATLHKMLGVVRAFLPPDPKVQEILDSVVANVIVTGSGGALATAGIILGIYLGTIFISTISHALSRTHGVTEDRHWWSRVPILSILLLFWFGITILLAFNITVFGETLAGIAEVNLQLGIPLQSWVAALNVPFTAIALVVLALALYLLTPENYLTIRQALPGAIFFSVGWMTVTKLFQFYVARYDRYNATYLALASIIMLLTWMYLTCLLLLLGGKLNAILRRETERATVRSSTPRPAANRSQHSISRALIRPRIILRWQLVLCALLLVAGFAGPITHGELTEEEKKQLFLKARENMRTVPTPTPEASATPRLLDTELDAALRDELVSIKQCFATRDVAEAIAAFREKRRPLFRGE